MTAALRAWRKSLRESLIDTRLSHTDAQRRVWSESICQSLVAALTLPTGSVVGFCWPYKGEPDVLTAIRQWISNGAMAALPVVEEERAPMVFRRWTPNTPMGLGVYNIPVPLDTEVVHPTVVLAPVVGFDTQGFRLGYGGGYFDRTMEQLRPPPYLVGVGFETSRVDTIQPQEHDIPMQAMVTEAGFFRFGQMPR